MKRISTLFILCSILFAYDPAYHMYLGSQTFDVWQNFDPEFYDCVTGAHPNIQARKFYYIGLTLPDMFDFQDGIASLIDSLYAFRDEIGAICDKTPVYIKTITRNNVQATIKFIDSPPNANFKALWRMANWARTHQSSPCYRALVYGAVMHVIHDLFAHQVLQPSRFGYGYAVQSDSMHAADDPVFLGEVYHELFTPTYIPDWSFITDELFRARIWRGGNYYMLAEPGVGYFEFMRTYNLAGQPIEGWQDANWEHVKTFVNAANAVGYHTQNLTQERLEAYIHGWGIMIFLLYGYRKGGGELGAVLAHPNWTFSQVFNYYSNIGDDYFRVSQVPKLIKLFQAFGAEGILYWFGGALFDLFLDKMLQNLIDKIVEFYLGNHPWPWYLQSTQGLDIIWDAVPYQYKSDTLTHLYSVAREEIKYWQTYSSVTKPNLRESYDNEDADSKAFKPLIKEVLENGYGYYDYDGYSLSRKAGLSGGMHPIPDENFYRQPGISKMNFYDGNKHIFEPTPVSVEGPPKYFDLKYQIVTFGHTKLEIWGKEEGGGGTATQLNVKIHDGPNISTSSFNVNAQSAVIQGYRELSFKTRSRKKTSPYNYEIMVDSDYRDVYYSQSEICNNEYYQSVLKDGDPTRTSFENPLTDPTYWWPYVLCIYPTPAPPAGLKVVGQPTQTSVEIQWADNSQIEEGFQIARATDGVWVEDYADTFSDITNYVDTVSFLHKYHYKVRSYDNEGHYSVWSNVITFTPGMLLLSDFSQMSAFDNQYKIAVGADGKLHLISYDGLKMFYAVSEDNGLSFSQAQYLYVQNPVDTTPSFALDNNDNPYVVYGSNERVTGSDYRVRYYVLQIKDPLPYPDRFYNSQSTNPGSRPAPPSMSFASDGCYIAFRHFYDGSIVVAGPYSSGGTPHTVISSWGYFPSIGYDATGNRLVVSILPDINTSPQIYWRTIGTSTWHQIDIPLNMNYIWSMGAPSLWVGQNELRIAFEAETLLTSTTTDTFLYSVRLNWNNNNYIPNPRERIGHTDADANYIEGYSSLASSDVVLWKWEDDIWFSQKAGTQWTTPKNVSETPAPEDISSYPQGIVLGGGVRRKLFALWTEKDGDDYYLARKILNLPYTYPYIDVARSDIPEATGYNNSQRLLRDGNNILNLAFTRDDNVYHTYLNDATWSEPSLIGSGKYPSLCMSADNNLYSIFAYNDGSPNFLEELRTSRFNGNNWLSPVPLMHTYGTYFWGVGAPSFAIADSLGHFIFETSYGPTYHPEPGGTMPMVIIIRGYTLIYGRFSLASPEDCQWFVLDSVPLHGIPVPFDTATYEDSVVAKLISPSITIDPDQVVHVLWEGFGDSLYYYRIEDTIITKQTSHGIMIDYPLITMREDQIDHFWCDQNEIRHRYAWTGIEELSGVETIAECENPFSSGPYLTWTKQDRYSSYLYYGVIPASGMIEPIELDHSKNLIACPQLLYNPADNNEFASLDIIWTDYSFIDSIGYIYYYNLPIEQVPPIYVFDMGEDVAVPIIVQRDGYQVLGQEDFQTIDYDSTELIYHLSLHSPHIKYKIRWTYYHDEPGELKLQFNVDDILHRNRKVPPSEKVTEEAWIPQACLEDYEITIKVKRLKGTIAVLSGLEIEMEQVGGGGPQGYSSQVLRRFLFEQMYPNPAKGFLKIRFTSPDERKVSVKIYDVVGRLAEKVFVGKAKVGVNEFLIMPKELSSGIYFVRVEANDYERTEKIILLR